jgi:hypothetical protein
MHPGPLRRQAPPARTRGAQAGRAPPRARAARRLRAPTAAATAAAGPTAPAVVVVGAGIGGLVAAGRLARAGAAVTLLEQNAGAGGRCQSVKRGGYRWDTVRAQRRLRHVGDEPSEPRTPARQGSRPLAPAGDPPRPLTPPFLSRCRRAPGPQPAAVPRHLPRGLCQARRPPGGPRRGLPRRARRLPRVLWAQRRRRQQQKRRRQQRHKWQSRECWREQQEQRRWAGQRHHHQWRRRRLHQPGPDVRRPADGAAAGGGGARCAGSGAVGFAVGWSSSHLECAPAPAPSLTLTPPPTPLLSAPPKARAPSLWRGLPTRAARSSSAPKTS